MPKLYDYFGLMLMFYSNEHEPVHVHEKCQGREAKAEFTILNGIVTEIRYGQMAGRPPLTPSEMRLFREIVTGRADEIVVKWIDYFVMQKPIVAEHITRRLK